MLILEGKTRAMIKVETEAEEGQPGEQQKKKASRAQTCKGALRSREQGRRGTHVDMALPLINYKINRNYKSQVVFIHKESGRRKEECQGGRYGGKRKIESTVLCNDLHGETIPQKWRHVYN